MSCCAGASTLGSISWIKGSVGRTVMYFCRTQGSFDARLVIRGRGLAEENAPTLMVYQHPVMVYQHPGRTPQAACQSTHSHVGT